MAARVAFALRLEAPVIIFDRYHVSGQSNTLMAHQPKQSKKSGIDRYSIPLWPGGANGA